MPRDPLGRVPRGYAVHRIGETWLVLDQARSAQLVRLRLADPQVREELFARAPRRGRGTAPSVELGDGSSAILRRYRHGGLLAPLTGALFFGPQRPLRELRVTARAEVSGAPVPHVLCLVLWPVVGPFWSAVIGTSEVRPAHDLLDALRAEDRARERLSLVRKTGTAIRKLHDAGVEHHDLQLRNILVTAESEPRIVVLDLDRATFHRYGLVPAASRARNLGRLARSVVKAGIWGALIGQREVAAFSGAYTRGNRVLRQELRARTPLERAKLVLHRLSYPFR